MEQENSELRAWQAGVRRRVSLNLQASIAQAIIRCEARRQREINTRPWDTAVERLYDYSTFIDMAQDMLKGLLT